MFPAARLPFLAATAFVAATTASPASADWQYTHWGMSKTQALLASNGALMPPGSRRERTPYVGLVGHYTSGDRSFDAALLFDDGDELVRVVLTQRTPRECAGTLAALQDKYGQAQNLATLRGATLLAWDDGAGRPSNCTQGFGPPHAASAVAIATRTKPRQSRFIARILTHTREPRLSAHHPRGRRRGRAHRGVAPGADSLFWRSEEFPRAGKPTARNPKLFREIVGTAPFLLVERTLCSLRRRLHPAVLTGRERAEVFD